MAGGRYLTELGMSTAVYVAALAVSNSILFHDPPHGLWRQGVALLPMLPACAICWAILRQLQRVDELQRRLQFEALALAFAATALLTFSYGFLEGIGYPKLSMFVVWPTMCAFWIIGVAIGFWRYR
jgi:hypothetical protein